MNMPSPPPMPQAVARTMFNLINDKWCWETKSLDNQVIATNETEGYNSLREALDDFFTHNGIAPADREGSWPENYGPLLRLSEIKYQINKYI